MLQPKPVGSPSRVRWADVRRGRREKKRSVDNLCIFFIY